MVHAFWKSGKEMGTGIPAHNNMNQFMIVSGMLRSAESNNEKAI